MRHVTGSDIDVVDMYRVGRFVDSKVRPIVVTLRSAWDRRIVLSNCRKFKDFAGRIFIVPDEEPDVRRQTPPLIGRGIKRCFCLTSDV